jgi:pilus assembly protein Flp/PilA
VTDRVVGWVERQRNPSTGIRGDARGYGTFSDNLTHPTQGFFRPRALRKLTLGHSSVRQQGAIVMNALMRVLRDESGATAIEYGLIAAGISIAIIAVVKGIGTQLNITFNSVLTGLQ